jgi:hypothetical protein
VNGNRSDEGPPGPFGDEPMGLDTTIAHPARIYDYWLGGKDNFPADQEAAEQVMAADPHTVFSVRANRAFLARAVRYLAGEAGVRQFLDVGTGIPSANNTHEVAQSVAPESRIVYVDNDPIVLVHARALLVSKPEGATNYVEADLRDTAKILGEAAELLDFSLPVAVMLLGVLQFIPDEDDPYAIVARLMTAAPPGSFLAISHPASDIEAEAMASAASLLSRMMAEKVTLRGESEVARFFRGLAPVEPGVVPIAQWRPTSSAEAASPANLWGGVARKL